MATRSEPLSTVNSLVSAKLRFVATSDKVVHDVEVLHVLAGGESGSGCGDEAPLSIDHVGREAAAADFLQAPDQELEIDDGRDHSQKAIAVFHGITDQKDGTRGFSFADDQRLTVVDAALAGGRIGALQFALQKGVRSDASAEIPLASEFSRVA